MVILPNTRGYTMLISPRDIEAWSVSPGGKRRLGSVGKSTLAGRHVELKVNSAGVCHLRIDKQNPGAEGGPGYSPKELQEMVAFFLSSGPASARGYWPARKVVF